MRAQLVTLTANNASADNILGELETNGAVIVSSLASHEVIAGITKEMTPHIQRTAKGQDDFSGQSTTRTGAIIARSSTAREIACNQLVLDTANTFLLPYCDKIQLMLTQIIRLLPGQGKQVMHRDRMVWGKHLRAVEPQLNTIWALTDFTLENGATQVVPGSHEWDEDRKPQTDEITQAVMPFGSVLIYTGSVIHSGGQNKSNHPRMGLNINYCLGWLRQEENQYLSCPPDIARTLSPALQELIGYTMPNYALGYFSAPGLAEDGASGVLAPEKALGREPRKIVQNRYLNVS